MRFTHLPVPGSKAAEKDLVIRDVLGHMFHDVFTMWYPVYEQNQFGEAKCLITFGDKLPKNRKSEVDLVMTLLGSPVPVLSAASARAHLAQYDFQFAENEEALIMAELAAVAQAQAASADPYGDRLAQEGGTGDDPPAA